MSAEPGVVEATGCSPANRKELMAKRTERGVLGTGSAVRCFVEAGLKPDPTLGYKMKLSFYSDRNTTASVKEDRPHENY